MHNQRIFIACIVLAACCCSAPAPAQAKRADSGAGDLQQNYISAQQSQRSGDLAQAARYYRIFLAEAEGDLAVGHAHAGDYPRAASLFDDALALVPDLPSLRLEYASAALGQGDLSRAETLARASLNEYPGSRQQLAQAHQILGRALLKANQDQDARKELEKAVALDSVFENGYALAVACLDLDDEKCAAQVFGEMETSFGDTPVIHMTFGRAYGNSDFAPQAVVEFNKVIAKAPRYPGAHYCLAAALLSLGDDAKNVPAAEAELKKELAISPRDFLSNAALGKLAAGEHKYAMAETYLKRSASLNAHNPDAFLYLGQMYFDLQRFPEAETNLRKAVQLTTDVSRNRYQIQKAHFLLGRILAQQHHTDEAHAEMQLARAFADKGLSHDKSELAGLLHNSTAAGGPDASTDAEGGTSTTGKIGIAKDADSAALAKLTAAEKQLAPALADSYFNLGAVAATSGNYAEAVGLFQHASVWNPTLDGLDLNLGRAAFMASRFSEAVPSLSRYIKLHPEDSGVRGALAMSRFMIADYAGCIDALKGTEGEIATIPQMQFVFAESLVKTGQVASGREKLESLVRAHPEIAEAHRGLGEALGLQGDRLKAIAELTTAIKLNEKDAEARYDLGKVEVESGNAAAAIPELEAAVQLLPAEPRYHRELAAAYKLGSRNEDAEKELAVFEKLSNPPAAKDTAEPATSK